MRLLARSILFRNRKAGNAQIFQLAQDDLQLRQLLLVRLADHHRGIDRRKCGAHVLRELDRAGTIDKGVTVAHETGRGGGEAHAHLVVPRLGAGIADRSSGIDAAGIFDGARSRQYRFQKCGFTALERAHQCNTPWTTGTSDVLSHCRLLVWSSALDWVGGTDAPPVPRFWQAGKRRCAASLRRQLHAVRRAWRHCGRWSPDR